MELVLLCKFHIQTEIIVELKADVIENIKIKLDIVKAGLAKFREK